MIRICGSVPFRERQTCRTKATVKRIAQLDPACQGMNSPLDWQGLVIVLAVHVAVVVALVYVRPSVDKVLVSPPIFANIIILERGEPIVPDPEPRAPVAEPKPADPPPQTTPRQPDPKPQLAIAQAVSVPAEPAVAEAGPEPIVEPVAPEADAAVAQAPTPPARTSLDSLPGSPDDVRKYIAAVMRHLHRHKKYPRELKRAKIEGTVLVQFTIDHDGHLIASDVKQGSGHAELDRAAMEMLSRADPLPAIPDFMSRDELALAIPVEYSLITDR
jgi:protein TonB